MDARTSRRLFEWTILGALAVGAGVHFHHLFLTPEPLDWIWVTVVFTLFCALHACYLLGTRAGLVYLAVGVFFGLFFEVLSINTGFPFGPYYYTDVLGPKVLEVPAIIPLAWFVVAYMTGTLANLVVDRRPMTGGGIGRLVWLSLLGGWATSAFDLAADPYFVQHVGAWVMERPGDYFGEEFRGVFGWALVAFTISMVFRLIHRRIGSRPRHRIDRRMAAVPVAGYAVWALFFSFAGYPPATRLITVFAMGFPLLAALSGLADWRPGEDRLEFRPK